MVLLKTMAVREERCRVTDRQLPPVRIAKTSNTVSMNTLIFEKSDLKELIADLRDSRARGERLPLPLLDSYLRHPAESVRKLAVELLESYTDPVVILLLLNASADVSLEVNLLAAEQLRAFRQPNAIGHLIKGLAHSAPEARLAAVTALREHRSEALVDPLLQRLSDGESEVRRETIFALAAYRRRDVMAGIRGSLKDESPAVRRAAVEIVATFDGALVFDDLISALSDVDWGVRRAAVANLSRFPSRATENALFDVLKDPAWQVVREALSALHRLGVKGDARLAAYLSHPVPEVRSAAAVVLGASNNPFWISYLAPLLADTDARVRRSAQQATSQLDPHLTPVEL